MAELNPATGKSGAKHTRQRLPLRVDLTAMVDLAFLLITFFMLTTVLTKPHAMKLAMPVGPPGGVPESHTITLCLGNKNHALWYLGMPEKPLTTPALVGYGKEMASMLQTANEKFKAIGKDLVVVIKPSNYSVYENLVDVLDELNITKVPTYAIANITGKDIDFLKEKGIY